MIFTVDDLCLKYLNNFKYFDDIKKEFPNFKLIAFTISNFQNEEDLKTNSEFQDWYEKHKEWVEIAVHSYDHEYPPDGDRDDEERWIMQAKDNLKSFLPPKYGYRSAGWQTTNKTESILKKYGFAYIAYENKIKYLGNKSIEYGIVNSHLYDLNSIKRTYEILQNNFRTGRDKIDLS